MSNPTSEYQVIYETQSSWETAYILKDLFAERSPFFVDNFQLTDLQGFPQSLIKRSALVFTSNLHFYEEILPVVKHLQPPVIVNLSDEWGDKPEFQQLADHCTLLLRQYYHPSYPQHENILSIPLGYAKEMFPEGSMQELPVSTAGRDFVWSFAGTMKSDRIEMLAEFESLTPHRVAFTTPEEMKELYCHSIFVPIGKGNRKLNCFRLYEASLCGAIPVIAGKEQEVAPLMEHLRSPPWITAPNWNEAASRCRALLEDKDRLAEMQRNLGEWWKSWILDIRKRINAALES